MLSSTTIFVFLAYLSIYNFFLLLYSLLYLSNCPLVFTEFAVPSPAHLFTSPFHLFFFCVFSTCHLSTNKSHLFSYTCRLHLTTCPLTLTSFPLCLINFHLSALLYFRSSVSLPPAHRSIYQPYPLFLICLLLLLQSNTIYCFLSVSPPLLRLPVLLFLLHFLLSLLSCSLFTLHSISTHCNSFYLPVDPTFTSLHYKTMLFYASSTP